MTPNDLVSDFPIPPGHDREFLLYTRLLLRYLADHAYSAELRSGAKLRDAIDFKMWFEEMAEACRSQTIKAGGSAPELRLELQQQKSCPICDHVHEGKDQCGRYLSELRFCKCTHPQEVTLR
jgi:hypothetical protein